MNIVVQRSDEDSLLAECDNSCSMGDKCVCRKVLGMENSGQGMYDYGMDKCVLCIRRDYSKEKSKNANAIPPYTVIPDGYPPSWMVGDIPFVRFNKGDYEVVGPRSVRHAPFPPTKVCPESWMTKIYETSVIKVPKSSIKWSLVVCESGGCEKVTHSFIGKHRAIGIDNSFFDLSDNVVKCSECRKGLKYIEDKGGVVEYKGKSYAKCRFCRTIINYDKTLPIQVCSTCLTEQQAELRLLERVCLYCNNTVPMNKKGGSQMLIVKRANGVIKDAYLCRHHKIKGLSDDIVYEHDYILKLLK